ncbi:MAG: hypothetical protein ACO3YZ_07720 [Candidatus Nanopelagicaceae bacterium]
MVTFSFFIPQEVIASMGLSNDGQTVSREVRVSDLLADGQISVDEYHALASAGVVFIPVPLFLFLSVEETAEGWYCKYQRLTNTKFLSMIFPGGKLGPIPGAEQWQLWLPEPPPGGFIYKKMLVRTSDVVAHKGYCILPNGTKLYSFSEGMVTIEPRDVNLAWVEMDLHTNLERRCNRSYLAHGGHYKISLDYLKIAY